MEAQEERYEYQQEDAAKVVRGMYRPTRVEELRSLLREEYLIQLHTMRRVEGVRDKRKALIVTPRFLVVGDVVGIDPDHVNIIVINAKIITPESRFKASKLLIRGDQVQHILLVEPSDVDEVVKAMASL